MEIKKYKVVCSQPKFSDEIYIDIAPDSGIIHDQIFYSRNLLHRQTSHQPLSRLYGSIYLQDNNGKISVEFPAPQARKGSPDYDGIMKQYAELEPKIVARYQEMINSGQETTLFVCSVSQMFEPSELNNTEADAFEQKRRAKMRQIEELTAKSTSYKQKHEAQTAPKAPQTLQEEEHQQQIAEFTGIRRRRIAGEQKRASTPLAAWQRFQKQYSGD